ncbi:unnamed protein product [Periconia digitata]|uniref:Uncharacterized protein n=1 Tax=Periconia digitata TaxID=1303443 RepID=A0A9W4U7E7_9PLEO|nr:unnamed protein product [Periconia digitata]
MSDNRPPNSALPNPFDDLFGDPQARPSTSASSNPFGDAQAIPPTSATSNPFDELHAGPSTFAPSNPFANPRTEPSTLELSNPFGDPHTESSAFSPSDPFGNPQVVPSRSAPLITRSEDGQKEDDKGKRKKGKPTKNEYHGLLEKVPISRPHKFRLQRKESKHEPYASNDRHPRVAVVVGSTVFPPELGKGRVYWMPEATIREYITPGSNMIIDTDPGPYGIEKPFGMIFLPLDDGPAFHLVRWWMIAGWLGTMLLYRRHQPAGEFISPVLGALRVWCILEKFDAMAVRRLKKEIVREAYEYYVGVLTEEPAVTDRKNPSFL